MVGSSVALDLEASVVASINSDLRAAVVAEALTWIGTPFHHAQAVKGRGVDCAMSLIEWFSSQGVIKKFDPRPYSATWFLHQGEEKFLKIIEEYADKLPEKARVLPADIALYRYGRCAAHGALIVDDEFIVHAYAVAGRVERTSRVSMEDALEGYWRVRGL